MATDLRLITDAAKADPYIAAVQRLRNALSDTRLAGTRRPHKEQNRTGLLFVERHDCDLLNDALLYFFQSVMILVQNLFCLI